MNISVQRNKWFLRIRSEWVWRTYSSVSEEDAVLIFSTNIILFNKVII